MTRAFRLIEGGKKPSIFADLDALRIEPESDDGLAKALQHSDGGGGEPPPTAFAMVPKLWFDRLKTLNRPAGLWRFAWVLVYRANLKPRFPVTSTIMWEAGVARQYKRKFLELLKGLGLVRVDWHPPPRVPWVTVLHLPKRRGRPK
jgi:hypothetical protein